MEIDSLEFYLTIGKIYNNIFGISIESWEERRGTILFAAGIPFSRCAYCKFVKKKKHNTCLNTWKVRFENICKPELKISHRLYGNYNIK